jgi:hypothetical protein
LWFQEKYFENNERTKQCKKKKIKLGGHHAIYEKLKDIILIFRSIQESLKTIYKLFLMGTKITITLGIKKRLEFHIKHELIAITFIEVK